MKTVLVSLLSEQTIPNVLAIRHFRPDRLLFVSTPQMEKEKKAEATLKSLARAGMDYFERNKQIEVDSDSIADIQRKLSPWMHRQKDVELVVNVTGGTKIMSLAAYEFFKEYGSRIIYIPIRRNEYLTLFPKKPGQKEEHIAVRMTVREYVEAYGLRVTNEHTLENSKKVAGSRRKEAGWIVEHYDDILNILRWFSEKLRPVRNKKSYAFSAARSATGSERELLRMLGFEYAGGTVKKRLARSEILFLTGGWIEEYCYNEIKDIEGIDDVELGLQVEKLQGTRNELDVMFTKDNVLYFVECKSLDQKHDPRQQEALYKVRALQHDFGLQVESFLVTTAPDVMKDGNIRESIKERAEYYKTRIIPPADVKDFRSILAGHLDLPGRKK